MSGITAAEEVLKQSEAISHLAGIASQYGPFFFALLFILFVPVLGQTWFSRILQTRIAGAQERAQALHVYRFYWMSGIVTGIFLVLVAVCWWIVYEFTCVVPATDEAIKSRIEQGIKSRVIEGIIRGTTDNDMFIFDFTNPHYKLYVYPVVNSTPMFARFVIIFNEDGRSLEPKIHFPYVTRATYEELAKTRNALSPTSIPLCSPEKYRDVTLVHEQESPPHFNIPCE